MRNRVLGQDGQVTDPALPSSDEPLVVTRDGSVATLWLNRPDKRNVVTEVMWAGITNAPTDIFLYNQFAMILTLTYIFIPFMVMPIYTALERIPPNLTEASADLGMNPWQTFLKVTLPLSMPGIAAGFTLTFCLSFGDFIAPFLVGGPDGNLIASVIQTQFGSALNWPLGSALSIVMLVIVLSIVSLSDRLERNSTPGGA